LFSHLNRIEPEKIISLIGQVYLPSLVIQLAMLLIVLAIARLTEGGYSGIGLAREDITWSNVLSAVIFFVGAWALIVVIKGAVERSGYLPEKEFLYLLPKSLGERIVWIILSLGAALAEETTFRGFAVSRLKILTGSYFFGAVLSSAAFSCGHLYQGVAGVFLTFLYGMLFSGLFIARRSIFPCIIAHFLQDAVILFIYRGPV
jgi:membrane protease YdiL (CAAX protease family)